MLILYSLLIVGCGNLQLAIAEPACKEKGLYEYLCNSDNTKKVENATLHTELFLSIISGALDPVAFGTFLINDVYYISRGPHRYLTALQQQDFDDEVTQFLWNQLKGYKKYNAAMFNEWHIKSTKAKKFVHPTKIIKDYSTYLQFIARERPNYLTVVANAPCTILWSKLGKALLQKMDEDNPLLHTVKNTFGPDQKGEDKFKAILDHIGQHLDDWEPAKDVFDRSMDFELRNFQSVDIPGFE